MKTFFKTRTCAERKTAVANLAVRRDDNLIDRYVVDTAGTAYHYSEIINLCIECDGVDDYTELPYIELKATASVNSEPIIRGIAQVLA